MRLLDPVLDQGYHIYMDNWYTSVPLMKELSKQKTMACGTIHPFRSVFTRLEKAERDARKKRARDEDRPSEYVPSWQSTVTRGSFRYHKDGDVIEWQWLDRNVVNLISNFHLGSEHDLCVRHTKVDGAHQKIKVPRPIVCADYNEYMGGVDKSDQMLKYYEVLWRSLKYWKKLFLHFIDLAVLNSYLCFKDLQVQYPDEEVLKRGSNYSHKIFRLELACSLGEIDQEARVPLYNPGPPAPNPRHIVHIPQHVSQKKACVVCAVRQKEKKI
jgi:hypothetical protein